MTDPGQPPVIDVNGKDISDLVVQKFPPPPVQHETTQTVRIEVGRQPEDAAWIQAGMDYKPKFGSVVDSGNRHEFETGSQRDTDDGKGFPSMLPPYALTRVSQHFQNGAAKYKRHNWAKGQPLSRYYDSMFRHMLKLQAGFTDEDHEAAIAWNILCFIETKKMIEEGVLPADLDDMSKEGGNPFSPWEGNNVNLESESCCENPHCTSC